MQRRILKTQTVLIVILLALVGCQKDSDVDALVGASPDVIEVPIDLQITITSPASDGKKVGYMGTLSGSCNQPGKSVEIRGDATGFSVCQGDNTWKAEVDFSTSTLGAATVKAYLVDNKRTSAPASRTFMKDNTDCDDEAARTAQYAGGSGSAGDPWMICTAAQLNNVRFNLADSYIMKNDVDLDSNPFTPIPSTYTGTFDGNDFSIQNLYIYDLSGSDIGLFKRSNGATFKNLTLENFNVTGPNVVAGLVARVVTGSTTISNITGNGKATASSNWVSGIVGYVDSGADVSITDIQMDAVLTGQGRIGTVVGGTHSSAGTVTIDTVVASGSATGSDSYVGGIAGLLDTPNNSLDDVTSSVTVIANGAGGTQDSYVGGIVGRMDGGYIHTCSSAGTVTGTSSYVGGVVGYFGGDEIHNCDVTGAIAVDTTNRGAVGIGGILGYATTSDTDLYQCSVKVNIAVTGANVAYEIGGIAGFFRGVRIEEVSADGDTVEGTRGTITTNTGDGATNGSYYVGGAVGYLYAYEGDDIIVDSSYANVDVTNTTNTTNSQTGGFAGLISTQDASAAATITITDTWASGDVTSYNRYVGGFVGNMYAARANSKITLSNVYASGNVVSQEALNGVSVNYIGGFCGAASTRDAGGDSQNPTGGFELTDVRASGDVTVTTTTVGGERVGGFFGSFTTGRTSVGGGTSTLTKVYATGDVTVTAGSTFNYVGGLFGYLVASVDSTIALPSNAVQSYALGNVTAPMANSVGGGFGYIAVSTNGTVQIEDFYSNGNVSGASNVGGFAGYAYGSATNGSISLNHVYSHDNNSTTAAPTVVGTGQDVGGLIGQSGLAGTGASFTLSNCSSVSPVTGVGGYTGGLIGHDYDNTQISDCWASGDVTGDAPYVGGLTGGSDRAGRSFTNVAATGKVTAHVSAPLSQGFVGGLSGRLAASSSVTKATATGDVLVSVDTTATVNEAYTGGLIGYMQGTVDQSYATGSVTVTNPGAGNQSYVGGLVGRGNDLITNSFATGNVQGGFYVGGLSGYQRTGVENSFAAGNVGGELQVGGLIGNYDGSAGTVTKVYALGSLTRTSGTQTNRFGPLVGYCNGGAGDAKVSGGFYNLSTSLVDANITTPESNCNSSTANETRGISDTAMLSPGTGFSGTFNFTATNPSDWRYPASFKKKGSATVYLYPILYWVEH